MTTARHFFAAAALVAALPAMAADPAPLIIDFEALGVINGDGVLTDGGAIGNTYAAQGVSFVSNAYGLASWHDPSTCTDPTDSLTCFGQADVGSLRPAADGSPGHIVAEIVSGTGPTFNLPCGTGSDPSCTNSQVLAVVNVDAMPKYTGVSVSYVYAGNTSAPPTMTLYSDYNGLGSMVGSSGPLQPLQKYREFCGQDNLGANFCDWQVSSITLDNQSFHSIVFKTTNGQSLFIDNLTFTPYVPPVPTPEPGTVALSLFGLAGVGLIARRRAGVKA
jgi:hypothetical protein